MTQVSRPLSPHMQVYRWQITMVLSIFHRMTGVVISGGLIVFSLWLYGIAFDATVYNFITTLLASTFGKIAILMAVAALFFHLANGVRHLFWDMGKGFANPQITRSGVMVVVFTILMAGLFATLIF